MLQLLPNNPVKYFSSTLSLLLIFNFAAFGQLVDNWIEDKNTGCRVFNPSPQESESVEINGKCVDGY